MKNEILSYIPRLLFFSDEQRNRLHRASMRILEEAGVLIFEEEALKLFKKAEARIEDGNRVHIPSHLVEWALSTAPKAVTLHNRNGEAVMPLESRNVFFGPGSDCLFVLDHRDGRRRPGTLGDVADIMRVCDALPQIDFLMSAVVPEDVPPATANHLQMLAMIENSIKPIMFVTNDFESSLKIVEAAEAVAGGEKAHREKPYCCCYINVTDPLRHNQESLKKLLFLAEKMVPTTYTPMVLRGVNGPVTGAGATALANAGELVGLVLAQLKQEGAPVIHSGGYGDVFDMRTMAGIYTGPESYGGRPAMGDFYGLPVFGLGGASDAKIPDGQAASEAALTLMLEALSGVNLVHDVGYLESGKCYSLEQLAICNELIGYIRRFLQGYDVSDETLALDLILEMGHHGEYLSTEHTVEHYKEDWKPSLFDRNNFDGWMAEGEKPLREKAKIQVIDILEHHHPPPLEPRLLQRVKEILL